jgi:c-di-GMP-binding flagellar brake protein YcgR
MGMKIGTVLQLLITQANKQNKKYRCKIIDKNDKYLFIDYPVDVKTKKTAFFNKGTVFDVFFIGEDEVVYHFRSRLAAKVKLNIKALAMTLPEELKRVQRRNFVRVDAAVDIAVHSPDQLFPPFTTVTNDISGGGVSILLPKHKKLKGKLVELWMVLPLAGGQYVYPHTKAELVFDKEGENGITIAAFKYVNIDQKMQQSIIRYCFEKQREARRKQLLD